MKPASKANLLLAMSLGILLAVIYAASQLVVLKGFLAVESTALERNAGRVRDALNDTMSSLDRSTADWAAWDDSYVFMQDHNPRFIEKNLSNDSLKVLRLNLVLYVNTAGRIVFSKTMDLDTLADMPLPDGMREYLAANPRLWQFTAPNGDRSGVIVVGGVPLLVGVRPITTSEGRGPIHGTLIMGRFLDAAEIARMADVTHVSLSMAVLGAADLPDDFRRAVKVVDRKSDLALVATDERRARAYSLVRGIDRRPVLMLRVEMPREIYRSGLYSINYFMCIVAAIVILFALLMRLLVGRLLSSLHRNREVEQRYRAVVEQSGEGIFQVDVESLALLDANGAFARLLGYKEQELVGLSLHDLYDRLPDVARNYVSTALKARRHVTHEVQYKRKDGTWVDLETGANVIAHDGKDVLSVVVRDITERKLAQERIHYLAHYDPLTNLPNRVLLRDRLQQDLARAERNHWMVAVIFLDLDRFKVINDSLGHHAGDRLLQTVATRLNECVRQGDTVSRQGGDEFVIVISEVRDNEALDAVAEKLLATVAASCLLHKQEVNVTTSIGISLYPQDGDDVDSLLKNADMAMYQAKAHGGNDCQLYSSDMNERTLERLNLESSLRHALEREEFSLVYQPQVDLGSGKLTGMEALLRWQHPQLGDVPPTKFIPLAEETGLILSIGEWVLRTACSQLQAWRCQGFEGLRMSVNISARQLLQKDLARRVGAILNDTGLAPSQLDLELTESMLMENMQENIGTLQALRQMGVAISIDDFGTGYSSLAYLQRLPIETLKIDRSFVRDIVAHDSEAPIALAVIALAHSLGHKVIAEGVETEAQLEFMRAHGCEAMQGYYFSKPLCAESFTELLRSGRSLPIHARLPLQAVKR